MSDTPQYADRYCAFVDILGFRQLIDQLDTSETSFEALRALLTRIHGAHSGAALDVNGTDFRAQSISDAVAISTNVSANGLGEIFKSLIALTLDLLVEGYFVRGAIVKAPLYHDEKMVVGQALVQAFHYESEVAKYPRIVVTRNVRTDIIAIGTTLEETELYPRIANLRQSVDGPMYLDILQPILNLLKKNDHPYKGKDLTTAEAAEIRRLPKIRDKIQERYEEAMDTPRHFEKVRWFAQYWNESIPHRFNLRIRHADLKF
jgi:hypothetical protein